MKLKYININGHGVLVDESAEITGYLYEWLYNTKTGETSNIGEPDENDVKIIFAEKELNLDVPILSNWRNWEVEQLVKEKYSIPFPNKFSNMNQEAYKERYAFIAGYNHNKAKYTEEDLRKAIEMAREGTLDYTFGDPYYEFEQGEDVIIQSLQRYPKHIVMESEQVIKEEYKTCPYVKEVGCIKNICTCYYFKPKLITNSENKQEGIIKEIIY